MTCPCDNPVWVWGDFIACRECGRRYLSPDEAAALRPEDDQ